MKERKQKDKDILLGETIVTDIIWNITPTVFLSPKIALSQFSILRQMRESILWLDTLFERYIAVQ